MKQEFNGNKGYWIEFMGIRYFTWKGTRWDGKKIWYLDGAECVKGAQGGFPRKKDAQIWAAYKILKLAK